MNLREWGSNSKEFLKSIPEQGKVKETITKVLGILWNTDADKLTVKGSKPRERPLKSNATVFYPLRFFTTPTLQGNSMGLGVKNGIRNWKKRCFING